jgi:hypothetical protein
MPRLHPKLWRQKNCLLQHYNAPLYTFFSTREFFFTKNNMTVVPTHPNFLFPRLKIKLKVRHFDTNEVIEEESQAVLNTLTELNLQGAFKKWQKRWKWYILVEGDYFEGDGGQKAQN